MYESKKTMHLILISILFLASCINNNMYDENIRPSEIRESQTTNEVA